LDKIPGVIAASADYETRTAKVTFDPAQTDVEALTEATANAGYPSTLKAEQ
jgi:mercuric ion binding protein